MLGTGITVEITSSIVKIWHDGSPGAEWICRGVQKDGTREDKRRFPDGDQEEYWAAWVYLGPLDPDDYPMATFDGTYDPSLSRVANAVRYGLPAPKMNWLNPIAA
ncbi:hypothetical protein [Mangrovibrevibacter kandeliae]|uniref:hypothetical protein n=1 Tax=Mangrovibrevibacter kandeliae TaxID=2968473 RepID=UPI0022317A14|nr:hypothetical protein [Aurantimonas sp. MSK8Z-1]